jgi:hypothetical protein
LTPGATPRHLVAVFHGTFDPMFHTLRIAALVVIGALVSSAAAVEQGPPAAVAQAVAATQAAKAPYAFDLELVSSEQNWRARFEPNATPHLRLLAPSRDALSENDRRAFDRMAEHMEGVSWCAGEGMGHVADVRLLREDADTATYSFQPTRDSIRGDQARRFADRLRGEFTLTKANPDIAAIRVFTPRSFSPLPLVNIERFNVAITCAAAPNGRHYAAETVSDVRGSAFGQVIDEHTVQRARNLSAAS